MADFNLLGTSLIGIHQEVATLIRTLGSASLSQLDWLATRHLLQPVQNNKPGQSSVSKRSGEAGLLAESLCLWSKEAGREIISRTLERSGKRITISFDL